MINNKHDSNIENILTVIMFFYIAIASTSIMVVSSTGFDGIITVPLSFIASTVLLVIFLSSLYKNPYLVIKYYVISLILVFISSILLLISATTFNFSFSDGVISFSDVVEFKQTETLALNFAFLGFGLFIISILNYIIRVKKPIK